MIWASIKVGGITYDAGCDITVAASASDYGYDISISTSSIPAYQWFKVTVTPKVSGWRSIRLYATDSNGKVYDMRLAESRSSSRYFYCDIEGSFTAYAKISYPDGTEYIGSTYSEQISWFVTPRGNSSPNDVSNCEDPNAW